MAAAILAAFGFVANEVQTEEAMFGIRFMFSLVPAILAVLGAISIFFYRLDRATIEQMERELAERHAQAAQDVHGNQERATA